MIDLYNNIFRPTITGKPHSTDFQSQTVCNDISRPTAFGKLYSNDCNTNQSRIVSDNVSRPTAIRKPHSYDREIISTTNVNEVLPDSNDVAYLESVLDDIGHEHRLGGNNTCKVKSEQTNDILDKDPYSGLTYTGAVIDQFFNSGAISKDILLGLLNTDSSNVLRHTITNEVNNNLKKTISSRKSTGNVVISEILTPEEITHIQLAYNDLDITFSNTTRVSHAYASASRKCERVILTKKLNVDLTGNKSDQILIKDIGGNIVKSTIMNEKNIHCCSPVLSPYDGTRISNRLYDAISFNTAGVFVDRQQRDIIKAFIENAGSRSPHKNFCFEKGEHCNVKANALMFLHSNYDISLVDFAEIMDSSEALVAYGSFIFDSRILTDDSGTIPWINAQFKIVKNNKGQRKRIYFSFSDCNGFNYDHDYETYIAYVSKSQFVSRSGKSFSLELLENRDGVQFFRVTRLFTTIGKAVTHKVYLSHLKDKYVIRFPYCSYSDEKFFNEGNTCTGLFNESFWKNLPKNTQWIYVPIDREIIDKAAAYVLGATCDKFKPENITNYLRSLLSREIMYSSVINKRDLPNHYVLSAVTHALYVVLYQTKYVFGKVMQQAISNVNATRTNLFPFLHLQEFDYESNCCLLRFIHWLFRVDPRNFTFDARQLIIEPPEYIEYVTDIVDYLVKIDANFLPIVPESFPLIASDLSSSFSDAFANIDTALDAVTMCQETCDSKVKEDEDDLLDSGFFECSREKDVDDSGDCYELQYVSSEEKPKYLDPLGVAESVPVRVPDNKTKIVADNTNADDGVYEEHAPLYYGNLADVEFCDEALDDDGCLFDDRDFSYKVAFTFDQELDLVEFTTTSPSYADVLETDSHEVLSTETCVEFECGDNLADIPTLGATVNQCVSKLLEVTELVSTDMPNSNIDTSDSEPVCIKDSPCVNPLIVTSSAVANILSSDPNIDTLSDDYLISPDYESTYKLIDAHANVESVKKYVNTVLPNGKSRGEAKMDEILDITKLNFNNFLDLCAAPGGFTKALLNWNPSASCTFHYYQSDRTLPLYDLPKGVKFLIGDLLVPLTVDACMASGKYDLVVADGCCDKGWDDESNMLLFASEIKVALGTLNKGGSFVIKLFCHKRYVTLLPVLSNNFGHIRLLRLNNSNKLSVEFYAVCMGFGGTTTISNAKIVSDIRVDLTYVLTQLGYPRLGILTQDCIDVDGSRNECTFIAACEDRRVDVDFLRKELIKDTVDPELIDQLSPGKMGGDELLHAISKYYRVSFSVDYCVNNKVMKCFVDSTNGRSFRTIHLRLKDYHYYIKLTCNKSSVRRHRRLNMFHPFDLTTVTTMLSKLISFKRTKDIFKIDRSGVYLVNNLSTVCTIHDDCRNNNQLMYYSGLYDLSLKGLNVSFILFFETDNFDMDFSEKCSETYPNIVMKPIRLDISGYFASIVYSTDSDSSPISDIVRSLNDHTCSDSLTNTDTVCECNTKSKIVYSPFKNVNLTVRVLRDIDDFQSGNILALRGHGENTCNNTDKIVLAMTKYFGWMNPTRYFTIGFETDYTNVSSMIGLLKDRCDVLYVNIKRIETYLPNVDNIAIMKNMMLEAHKLWSNEKQHALNSLSSGYNLHTNGVGRNYNDSSTVDTSFALLDLNRKTYTIGLNINAPYNWGYSNGVLINTSKLFKNRTIDHAVAKDLIRRGHTHIAFNSNSRVLNGVELSTKYNIAEITNLHNFDIVFYQGVPGAGKTHLILSNNMGKRENLILTVTREAKDDMRRRAIDMGLVLSKDRIRTVDSYLVNGGAVNVDELWVDEALLVHAGYLIWAAMLSGCNKLIIVGDSAQILYINRNGDFVCYSDIGMLKVHHEYLKTDYRNPLDIVYWLHTSGNYDFDVTGVSNVLQSVECRMISGSGELKPDDNTKYLTFTQAEKVQLGPGFNASTIHEYQGNQTDNVVLIRLNHKKADIIFESRPHILVALTRHRKSFKYLTVLEDTMSKTISHIKNFTKNDIKTVKLSKAGADNVPCPIINEEFNKSCRREEYYAVPDTSATLYLENREIRNILLSNGECGYVSWDYGVTKNFSDNPVPIERKYYGCCYNLLQDFHDRILPGSSTIADSHDHINFEYYSLTYDCPGVLVRDTMPNFKKYDFLCPQLRTAIQSPIHDSTKTHLKAFNERNGQVPQLQGTIDALKEAKILLDKFKLLFARKCDFTDKPVIPDIRKLEEWLNQQPPRIRNMIMSEDDFHDQNFSSHDFILKNIAKIDLERGCHSRYKSPQTIIHQQKTVNSVFCPIMRQLLQRVEYCLHRDIIMYNGMSPQEFCQHLNRVFPPRRYRKMHKFLEIDFSKYDKSQGLVLLIFEALLMELFGVPALYIKIWIVMHRLSVVHSRAGGFTAFVEYQRKSGDAATWTLNTIIQIAVLNRVLRIYIFIKNGKIICLFSGDDSLIFYIEDFEDLYFKMCQLQFLYNLEAKLMNYNIPYFCSKFLLIVDEHWIFVPDTLKLIVKLGRKDLVDYEHARCYRVSFDDNLYYYKFIENWPYISSAINDRYNINGEHDIIFETLLDAADSDKKFFALYSEPRDYVSRKFTIRPNLEI
nr:MAG: ORF1 protein [Riboviria sp.]